MVQVLGGFEHKAAFAHMLGQAAGLGELSATAQAFILSLSGVDWHVLVQLGLAGKASWAVGTLEPMYPAHLKQVYKACQ